MLPEPRYIVTELIGYLDDRSSHRQVAGRAGVSFHVIDRHYNYRLVGTYRSEEQERLDGRFARNETKIARARERAELLAATLQDEHEERIA